MKINQHFGIVRPLNYDDVIASSWSLWSTDQMGVLDLPMFYTLREKLTTHAQRCINRAKDRAGRDLTFKITSDSRMLRVHFYDENDHLIHLKDCIKYSDFPKFTPITIRRLLEMIYRNCDESVVYTKEFYSFTEMMLEDLAEKQLLTLTNAFPWLEMTNTHFSKYSSARDSDSSN